MKADTANLISSYLEDAGYKGKVRKYSGRGMFGQKTFGIVTDMDFELTNDILDELPEDAQNDEEIQKAFESMRCDSMGLDVILY